MTADSGWYCSLIKSNNFWFFLSGLFLAIRKPSFKIIIFYLKRRVFHIQFISQSLWNGSLSAIGTAIAFGHPLSIITAFIMAPITSLNPFLAAGFFVGFTQAYVKRPTVNDFESLSTDIYNVKGFWKNSVTKVLLVILFANIGSSLGTFIGGIDIIRLFMKVF